MKYYILRSNSRVYNLRNRTFIYNFKKRRPNAKVFNPY